MNYNDMQQEYSQPLILLSPHFRWVVNLCIPPYIPILPGPFGGPRNRLFQ